MFQKGETKALFLLMIKGKDIVVFGSEPSGLFWYGLIRNLSS
jgi:hypothetical protein